MPQPAFILSLAPLSLSGACSFDPYGDSGDPHCRDYEPVMCGPGEYADLALDYDGCAAPVCKECPMVFEGECGPGQTQVNLTDPRGCWVAVCQADPPGCPPLETEPCPAGTFRNDVVNVSGCLLTSCEPCPVLEPIVCGPDERLEDPGDAHGCSAPRCVPNDPCLASDGANELPPSCQPEGCPPLETCPEGQRGVKTVDDAGCLTVSCEPAGDCPDDAEVRWVSTDPDVCAVSDFVCREDELFYTGDPSCGCGCQVCPSGPDLHYNSRDATQCPDFECAQTQVFFSNACGCGCRDRVFDDCVLGGCSGELCIEATSEPPITPCVWDERNTCLYEHGVCARQADGQCNWTQSSELAACLESAQ